MTSIITGIPVTLYNETQDGTDAFNAPIWVETSVTVPNVLVGQPSEQEILDTINLYGKRAVYVLHIPKGDTHDWTNKRVEFKDSSGTVRADRTIGEPIEWMEHLVPLDWNKKVRVETYVEG